ncbi:hypothetical protein [Prolixibacter bellariivorans]|uniref:hypothetical protein n=1 Tax=Prolixibacter bellariivorans TaxID=314319 RepID=UPI0004723D87|nr:hypothetical protein [Prolixibacter bellariivorans]
MNYKLALLFGVLVWMGIAPLYAVDTPPVMNGHDTSPKYYKETNTPVALFPDFTITDAENDDIKGLVIAFTSGNHTDQDILSFTDQNGITGSFDKTKGALVLSGAAHQLITKQQCVALLIQMMQHLGLPAMTSEH